MQEHRPRLGSLNVRTAAAPRATYRLQLHAGFTFEDARRIVPYLASLGISHLYCSPYFRARPGSTHGYDVVDHNTFNPEIGTRADFERFVAALSEHDMSHIADFVPNHVGIMGADNVWWLDVLENGPHSRYAQYFDIDWEPADPLLKGKVLVPILGDSYGAVLERGELQLCHEPAADTFSVRYHEHRFPINARDRDRARAALEHPSPDALHELLERQAYRLAHWRVAADEVNYRRFFDVNDLAALRMENAEVFGATHRLILELLQAGQVAGLRIDHPDGLFDPARYFERLQARFAAIRPARSPKSGRTALYVLAEKITAHYEHLRAGWPIAGSTGYDFANLVNGLFVDRSRRARFDRVYRAFTGEHRSWQEIVFESKHLIVRTSLAAEVSVLANQLHGIARADRRTRDFSLNALRQALRDVIAAFPVYRTYLAREATADDERYIHWAVARAKVRNQGADVGIYDFILDVLIGRNAVSGAHAAQARRAFAMKLQQVTAPAAAKGVEDTAFYRFGRLLSLNEVGGDPDVFGISVAAFHRENRRRMSRWPQAMLASSTHDTKRSEDVRARIDVLSEMPGFWREALQRWQRINRSRRTLVEDQQAPSPEDEHLIYQTLIGSVPLQRPDEAGLALYRERIAQFAVKAAREAKVRTSWANVNEPYEHALQSFVGAILDAQSGALFLDDLFASAARIQQFGLVNSLAQTLLKLTCPGVPDIYQGNELWDFSLVDPDNRRAVDFGARAALLEQVRGWEGLAPRQLQERLASLWAEPADGRAKLYLTWRALNLRRTSERLFRRGRYLALRTTGLHAARVCAFARVLGGECALIVAPRLCARLFAEGASWTPGASWWADTAVLLHPKLQQRRFASLLDGQSLNAAGLADGSMSLPVAGMLRWFPAALLSAHI